jgi:hypothetical protein
LCWAIQPPKSIRKIGVSLIPFPTAAGEGEGGEEEREGRGAYRAGRGRHRSESEVGRGKMCARGAQREREGFGGRGG